MIKNILIIVLIIAVIAQIIIFKIQIKLKSNVKDMIDGAYARGYNDGCRDTLLGIREDMK